jgi:protein-S-isoprenylcysteine O-methyltransferase Ste14
MDRDNRLRRFGPWATAALYVTAVLEMAVMATPFAAYFYAVYSPILQFLQKSPYTIWLNELFVTHLSVPDSWPLRCVPVGSGVVAAAGVLSFLTHAAYLYWVKFARKGIATRLLYRYVRHPQYASLMVAGLGLAFVWPRFLHLILYLAMVGAYRALARHEERRMAERHAQGYLEYAAAKPAFFPRMRRRRPVSLDGRAGGASPGLTLKASRKGFAPAVLIVAGTLLGAFGLRAYSVSKVHVFHRDGLPATTVLALDPPPAVRDAQESLAEIASDLPNDAGVETRLLFLIWDEDRLRHFLSDGGVLKSALAGVEFPSASLFAVEASLHLAGGRNGTQDIPNLNPFALTVVRRLLRVWYRPDDAATSWTPLELPAGAAQGHVSLPVL